MKGLTPMMQQYMAIKENHKDHILFYRLGDFYEMFFDDALIAVKELELALTGRDCGLKDRAPMAGIPYHSADGYIAKLIEKGYKVAVCEQTQAASEAVGLVTREVVRVITPGTVMEDNLLDIGANNFLGSIFVGKSGYGLAFADISTGEVHLVQTDSKEASVINELTRYFPREVIFNAEFVDKKEITGFVKNNLHCTADLLDDFAFEKENAKKNILKHFNAKDLEELKLNYSSLYIEALGGLLEYLKETQITGMERLITLHVQEPHRYMNLDQSARVNLELLRTLRTGEKRGSLLWILDQTKTPMGKRLIRTTMQQPLISPLDIDKRLNAVEEFHRDELFSGDLREVLSHVYDVERLLTRIVYGSASPREYKTLQQTMEQFPTLKKTLSNVKAENLKQIFSNIDPLEDLSGYILRAILEDPPAVARDGNVINHGFSEELDMLRDLISNARGHLSELEDKERKESGIKTLKVGYNRVFGYYFEVTKSNINMVPERYIRKQTLANSERYITEELKVLEEQISSAREKTLVLEIKLFEEIRQHTITHLHRIQATATAIAWLDVYLSFAYVSLQNRYTRPDVNFSDKLDIKDGRHPVVEQMLDGVPFVPNDTYLDCGDNRVSIITGPNMAGKSTYMRQTAIIVLMAQMGCFVPAKHASIGVVDGIYTRIGASDDLTSGESTFMIEMKEVAEILKNATNKSLLILDEIGRGTSTYDGMSIARAVIEYTADISKLGAKTLFATHYHELTAMEGEVTGVNNYHIVAKKRGEDIIFLRRIVPGGTDDSYGIEVSKLAGVPNWIVKRAHTILEELEKNRPIHVVREISKQSDPQQSLLNRDSLYMPLTDELDALDVETLTPLEALNKLYEIKELYNKGK